MKAHHSALFVLGLGSLAAVTSGSAQADSRDEVMRASQRCAAFADARTWLDCYYGAAQPMRNQLGLTPAPANQQRIVPQVTATMPPPAYAEPSQPAPRMANTAAGTAPLPRRSGGFFDRFWGDSKPVRANQRVKSWTTSQATGLFTIVLSNGEKWEQVFGDSPRWRGNPQDLVVNITHGAVGTYNMKVSGDTKVYKVQLVK